MPQPRGPCLIAGIMVVGLSALLAVWSRPAQAQRPDQQPGAAALLPAAQVPPPTHPPAQLPAAPPRSLDPAAQQLPPCPGSWSLQASYPITITGQAMVGQGSFIYSFGGYDDVGNYLAAAYKYNSAINSWTALAPLPAARVSAQAVSDGLYIYILGGYGTGSADSYGSTTLWRYNPANNTYATLAPALIPVYAHAAAYLDGKIYRIAGCTPFSAGLCLSTGQPTNSVEVYTIATNTWAAAAPYPHHAAFVMATGYNGYVYAAGGFITGGKAYRYDPPIDRWEDAPMADLPSTDAAGAATGWLNGRWVLAGGYVNGAQDGVIGWNPGTNAWEPLPPLLHAQWFGAGATVGSAFYVVGGGDVSTGPFSYNQRYLETPCATPTVPPPSPTPSPTVCGVGRWTEEASVPALVASNAVVGHNGRLYSFGGWGIDRVLTTTYAYDPPSAAWSPRAPLPTPIAGAQAVSDGSIIYLVGGSDLGGNGAGNTLWRYDPVANSYTALAPYTIPTDGHAAVLLNGKIYRIGGEGGSGPTNSVEVYTIATNSWVAAAAYPEAVSALSAVVLNGYIYAAGGVNSFPNMTNKAYRYDPATNTWDDAAVADLPAVRWAAATGVYHGRWLIAGGGGQSAPFYRSVLAWNPVTNLWTPLPDLAQGRLFIAGASLSDGFYAIGGYDDNNTATTFDERYTESPCGGTPTGTPTNTATPTNTRIPTNTRTPTNTVTGTPPTATPTFTACPVQFNDVPSGSTFYAFVHCLACRGIVGGYPCGGPGEPCPGAYYRPNNNLTRGQVSKIVSASAGFADPVPSTHQTFEDVSPGSTFHLWIERLAGRGIIGGYPCGGPFEPCIAPGNRPYFRPNNNVTRGQLSKITSGAAGWTETPTGQTFEDVPPGSTFYLTIERMAARGIISGYPCGGPFEPCLPPDNRPYFRPNNNATRGQMSKIAAEAFFPNCATPARR